MEWLPNANSLLQMPLQVNKSNISLIHPRPFKSFCQEKFYVFGSLKRNKAFNYFFFFYELEITGARTFKESTEV